MNILVTGGAGYIGSKFCYDAGEKGYKIIIVDNLSTGEKINTQKFYILQMWYFKSKKN